MPSGTTCAGRRPARAGPVLRPGVPDGFPRLQCHPAAGAWLSLAEHLVRDQGVAGSNPAAPTRPVLPDGFRALRRPWHSAPPDAPSQSAPFRQGPGASLPALTHGPKRVYSGALAGDVLPRRAPFFMLLLLDIPELDVMELARMFAPATSARSTDRVRSKVFDAGFLPLAPEPHILAARMAGAGTHR